MPVFALVAGDLLVLFVFVLLGREDHDMSFSLSASLETAVPFVVGWIAALAIARTYRLSSIASARKAFGWALLTCLIAVPIGLALRSVWLGRLPGGSFAIVAFPLVAGFMTVWRVICVWLFSLFLPNRRFK